MPKGKNISTIPAGELKPSQIAWRDANGVTRTGKFVHGIDSSV